MGMPLTQVCRDLEEANEGERDYHRTETGLWPRRRLFIGTETLRRLDRIVAIAEEPAFVLALLLSPFPNRPGVAP
jgi:hypothetical protein